MISRIKQGIIALRLSRRMGASSTGMALVVLMAALLGGAVLGIFITGFLSFLQPILPFLFAPIMIINYPLVPIGFVVTALATFPILAYLAKHTQTEVAPA